MFFFNTTAKTYRLSSKSNLFPTKAIKIEGFAVSCNPFIQFFAFLNVSFIIYLIK